MDIPILITGNEKTQTDDLGSLNCKFEALKTITHVLNKTKTPTTDEILNVKHWFYMLVKERLIIDPFAVVDLICDIESNVPPAVIKEPIAIIDNPLMSTECKVALIKSFVQLSIHAKRLLLAALFRPSETINSDLRTVNYLSYRDLFSASHFQRDIKTGINDLLDATIIFNNNNNNNNNNSSGNWVSSYSDNSKGITLELCRSALLFGDILSQGQSDLLIDTAATLRKPHTLSIFTMMVFSQTIGEKFSVSEIIGLLKAGDSYHRVADLRDKVLQTSRNDIAKHTDFLASFIEQNEEGGSTAVSHITFSLDKK